jgi:outer membrane protein OmpA-like peptidoglycan-associated protein
VFCTFLFSYGWLITVSFCALMTLLIDTKCLLFRQASRIVPVDRLCGFVRSSSVFSLLLLFFVIDVHAVSLRYQPRVDEAQWLVSSSKFECRMTQPIPVYGSAVFSRRAGEEVKFSLNTSLSPMSKGQAALISDNPSWDMHLPPKRLAMVNVERSDTPVTVGQVLATRLLAELEKGRAPRFAQKAWYNNAEQVSVAISSVNFRMAYAEYRSCLAELLPVNFDQIARTRVHFPVNKSYLSAASKRRLDKIVEYVKEDKEVNAFFVDGHTDNQADRLFNYELSKKRSQAVTAYLVEQGIDETMITTRYHGERYPIVKNNTAANRRQNRRVTLRLEKQPE